MKIDKQEKERRTTGRIQVFDRLCSGSGLLLSVVCCVALIYQELRIQENYRLISPSAKFCGKLEPQNLRNMQQNIGGWQVMATESPWQGLKGTCSALLCNLSI